MKFFFKPQMIYLTMFTTSLFVGCETETFESESSLSQNGNFEIEEAYPDQTGKLHSILLDGEEVMVENFGDNNVSVIGDMLFYTDNSDSTKSVGRTGGRWPNNIVYYEIQSGMPNQARIRNAIGHWEANTALRFVKRTNQSAYVFFQKGGGCSSFVGRTGRKQTINLADGCSTGSTIHEIGHAIGLYHEQSRKDRDRFIKVLFGNIQSGKEHNFQTYVQRGRDGTENTSTLDFGSIMMYSPKSFSNNGQPTITKVDGSSYSTQRNGLSSADITGINKMYPGNTNLAAGKPSFQSSTYNNDTNRFGPSKTVDRNTNNFSHTNKQNNAWWEVDLGFNADIKDVQIWNRADCCQNRLTDFDIKVYDRRGGRQIKSIRINEEARRGKSYDVNARGRVVRIQLRDRNFLHMAEVRVNGTRVR
ncbi:M12 family metallopeptidase [Aquimarina aggregata]|uniref:M12 family metallopeptidase n=1 Tax=Aquimarina aggregata TaxID=1642818 RepID=UPI00248FDFB6|nr:M12 family metallopeptidase [Aquimarina aggregata]